MNVEIEQVVTVTQTLMGLGVNPNALGGLVKQVVHGMDKNGTTPQQETASLADVSLAQAPVQKPQTPTVHKKRKAGSISEQVIINLMPDLPNSRDA